MIIFLIKLIAAPLLLALATLAARRWGTVLGGILIGLPLISGPISVFLAIENGAGFDGQKNRNMSGDQPEAHWLEPLHLLSSPVSMRRSALKDGLKLLF